MNSHPAKGKYFQRGRLHHLYIRVVVHLALDSYHASSSFPGKLEFPGIFYFLQEKKNSAAEINDISMKPSPVCSNYYCRKYYVRDFENFDPKKSYEA